VIGIGERVKYLVLFFALLSSCGDQPLEEFIACGGDLVGTQWNLTFARVLEGGDGCTESAATGTLVFNTNGRYSITANHTAWKQTAAAGMCGVATSFGGFYRLEGRQICFGDSSAEGSAIPCDGSMPTQQHAVADYCVTGDRLVLRSKTFIGLRFPGELELSRRL
jgi:hypothetical protein